MNEVETHHSGPWALEAPSSRAKLVRQVAYRDTNEDWHDTQLSGFRVVARRDD
jgi:hypothetical protein